jgi:hypothetical protein
MDACADIQRPLYTTDFSYMLQVPGKDQWLYASTNRGVLQLDLGNADYNYIAWISTGVPSMSSDLDVDGKLDTCASVCSLTVSALVLSPSMS